MLGAPCSVKRRDPGWLQASLFALLVESALLECPVMPEAYDFDSQCVLHASLLKS